MKSDINKELITIQSSELFFLENELADLGSRAFAYLLDLIFRALGMIAFGIVGSWIGALYGNRIIIIIPIIFIWFIGYPVFFEIVYNGKTPGKKIVGLRVLKSDGSRLSILDSIIRNIMRIVDSLPMGYFIGMLVILFEKHKRRVGDILANTIVIYDRSANKSILDYLNKALVDSNPRMSIQISGLNNLSENEKIIIKNLYARLDNIKEGPSKAELMSKFYNNILKKVKVVGTEDPEVLLCEIYKRI